MIQLAEVPLLTTGANDLVFPTLKLMILPLCV